MPQEWNELRKLTGDQEIVIERVRLNPSKIALEGQFELPSLARLTAEDQVFVTAFVRSHGSIKQMEQLFGVSYPTIKNRLNRIAESLDYVEINAEPRSDTTVDRLARGEINVKEALDILTREKNHE